MNRKITYLKLEIVENDQNKQQESRSMLKKVQKTNISNK